MTPPYSELVAAVRREGASLLAAGSLGVDVDVPTCPGWEVADLLTHVGRIYRRVATLVSTRATAAPESRPPLPEGDLVEVVTELLDDLVEQLAAVEPDTPVWNWSNEPDLAAFWARRMAHESAVHRYDAQRAHGVAEPIDADLAADGLDEMIDVIAPLILGRVEAKLPTGALVLRTTDDGESVDRPLALSAAGVARADVAPAAATVVTATSSTLLLALIGRIAWSSLDVDGDESLLAGWSETLQF